LRRAAKFVRLSPAEKRVLVFATFLVASTRLGLSVVPVQTTRRMLRWLAPLPGQCRAVDCHSVSQLTWAVRAAGRFVPRATCLTQALAGQALLARYGHAARLRAGVARDEQGKIEGHAWLEHGGEVVVGGIDELERYTDLEGWEEVTRADG